MERDSNRPPIARFAGSIWVALLLAATLVGCATLPRHPAESEPSSVPATAVDGTIAPTAETSPPPERSAESVLAARAEEAAGDVAREQGDAAAARKHFAEALRLLESGPDDPRIAEVAEEIEAKLRDLEPDGSPEPEADGEEVEPSPLDELDTVQPGVAPGELERERNLIEQNAPAFDIPMVVNEKVIAWIDYYTRAHKEKFQQGLVRSGRYLPLIHRIFTEAGLPKDLAYMAHVESAYKPHAYSRAKAKGIFQFIRSTGVRYGLRVDGWVDERSDPEKATRAAAAYLTDLYGMFGDWYLALAAYNAGEGKIQRTLASTRAVDFWTLASRRVLRNETTNYVPAILAAVLISKDPVRYGFEFQPETPVDYDTIRVDESVHLEVLARCAGSSVETLRDLNPALRRRMTPPYAFDVRVPTGKGEATLAALAEVPRWQRSVVATHKVAEGETLAKVARRYGVSVSGLQRANRMGKRTVLKPGESLVIPDGGEVYSEHRDVPSAGSSAVYRVRSGDTLGSIAKRYRTTPAAIASANGIRINSVLRIGQKLVIRGRAAASASIAAGARTASAAGATSGARRVIHTVRRGETLHRIATRYRITVDELCAMNRIRRDETLYPGTRLTVPGD